MGFCVNTTANDDLWERGLFGSRFHLGREACLEKDRHSSRSRKPRNHMFGSMKERKRTGSRKRFQVSKRTPTVYFL